MRVHVLSVSLCAALAAALSGCATSGNETVAATGNADQQKIVAQQQSQIKSLQSELQTRESELASARKAASAQSSAGAPALAAELFPPDAKPGRCYARVLIPAKFKNEQETVLLKEQSQRVEIIPARYETVEESVLIREASTRLEVVPAKYETVEERILVQPESTVIEEIPATYRTVTDQVQITPARTEWKRGAAGSFAGKANVLDSRSTDTGEIMCLVEIPAEYRTVTKTVVDQPARTREVKVPAQYNTVKKTVVVEPATTREIAVPAEYGTVKVTKLVSPAADRKIEIPAEYGQVTKRIKVSEDELEWRQVLCDINMTPANIRTLQTSLRDQGYEAGPVDGVLGSQTLSAANSYAKAKGLPYGTNYITVQAADKLGLSY